MTSIIHKILIPFAHNIPIQILQETAKNSIHVLTSKRGAKWLSTTKKTRSPGECDQSEKKTSNNNSHSQQKKHIATHAGNRGASERKTVFVQSPNLHKLIGEKDLSTFFYSLDPTRETAGGKNLWRQFSQRNLSLPLFLPPRIKSHCWQ